MSKITRLHPAVVLVTPQHEGNVGAVARAMANLGLDELILVEPAPPLAGVARGFGVGGWPILDRARRVESLAEALGPFHLAIGTTSARERPLHRRPVLDVRDLATTIGSRVPVDGRVAVVFGREDNGLSREHLECCDPVVTIPCAADRPTLNLAQAVLLTAWELHRARIEPGAGSDGTTSIEPATWAERQTLLDLADPLVHELGFDHDHIHKSVLRDLRRLLDRARPDHREASLLRRLLNRANTRLGADSRR